MSIESDILTGFIMLQQPPMFTFSVCVFTTSFLDYNGLNPKFFCRLSLNSVPICEGESLFLYSERREQIFGPEPTSFSFSGVPKLKTKFKFLMTNKMF